MAGGAGHVMDMIARMRNNKNMLNKSGYFRTKEVYIKISNRTGYDYKKATPEELGAIRAQVIEQKKAEK